MDAFSLHPNVYATSPLTSLLRMLEKVWVQNHTPGQGVLYIISGFGMYNGGIRFFDVFEEHIRKGGRVVCFFAGSASQKLTSRQLVDELVNAGAEVHIVNRKRLLHAKLYGVSDPNGDVLIVTSGNFTGAGLSLNGEAALLLDENSTKRLTFSWNALETSIKSQTWNRYPLSATNPTDPGWQLLYDEQARGIALDDTEEVTLLTTLGHADTIRIQSAPGTTASKGSQYFWLSRDSYGFFPPLTVRNRRGVKSAFSCMVTIHYVPIRLSRQERVTFEADNNLDFRLGTGALRHTRAANTGDLAAVSRTGEDEYELRIFAPNDPNFGLLRPYAINFIGNRGKQYGFIDNDEFTRLTGIRLPSVPKGGFP